MKVKAKQQKFIQWMLSTFIVIRSLDQSQTHYSELERSTNSVTYLLERYWSMAFIYSVRKEPFAKVEQRVGINHNAVALLQNAPLRKSTSYNTPSQKQFTLIEIMSARERARFVNLCQRDGVLYKVVLIWSVTGFFMKALTFAISLSEQHAYPRFIWPV